MKILYILPSKGRGGCEEYAINLAESSARNHDKIAVAIPFVEETQTIIEDLKKAKVCVIPLNSDFFFNEDNLNKKRLIYNLWLTIKILLSFQPQVVHIILPWPLRVKGILFSLRLLRIRTVVTFQLFPYKFELSDDLKKFYTWCFQRFRIIAVSGQNKQLIQETFGLSDDQVTVIQNGVKTFNVSREKKILLKKVLDLQERKFIITTTGRLSNQKGHDLILKIAPKLVKSFPHVHFLWLGDGELREQYEQAIQEAGLTTFFSLKGNVTNINDYLTVTDLFLFPSRYEGQPFSLLEAMAGALPVLSSDASGIKEIIRHQENGFLFTNENAQELYEKLSTLIAGIDTEEVKKAAKAAQDTIDTDFSYNYMIKATAGLYNF